jgi:hypothetical protein
MERVRSLTLSAAASIVDNCAHSVSMRATMRGELSEIDEDAAKKCFEMGDGEARRRDGMENDGDGVTGVVRAHENCV